MKNKSLKSSLVVLMLGVFILGGGLVTLNAYAGPKAEDVKAQQPLKIVNINQASPEELQTIRGIGPAIAQRILEYRQEHGRFEKAEDLVSIRGIGAAKFERIKSQIAV
jgi:competence protein ComEA